MAMAHSVEMRPPFLDHRIIEYMGRVPARRKIPVLREKHLLKKVFEGILPEQVLNRPKHPYRAPIKESLWDAGTPGLRDLLSERAIRDAGLFDPGRVGHFVTKLEKTGPLGEFDGMALAGILSAQSVHRQFVADFRGASIPAVEPDVFVDRRTGSGRSDV